MEHGTKKIEKKYFRQWPRLIRRAIIVLAVLAVLIFLSYKVERIFTPPLLDISFPKDGSVTNLRHLDIIGQSQKEVEVVVNNKNALVDEEGKFIVPMDLQKGLNLIKITAKKRYSRMRVMEIRVLLK